MQPLKRHHQYFLLSLIFLCVTIIFIGIVVSNQFDYANRILAGLFAMITGSCWTVSFIKAINLWRSWRHYRNQQEKIRQKYPRLAKKDGKYHYHTDHDNLSERNKQAEVLNKKKNR